MGFNAANETMVDMISTGIIDPTKVNRQNRIYFFIKIKLESMALMITFRGLCSRRREYRLNNTSFYNMELLIYCPILYDDSIYYEPKETTNSSIIVPTCLTNNTGCCFSFDY